MAADVGKVAAVDIGGSGCRAAWVDLRADGRHVVGAVHRLESVGSRAELSQAVTRSLGHVERLGISTAGFVDSQAGVVTLCRVQPWLTGEVRARMEQCLTGARVAVVNDGEAHLLAHLGESLLHPAICLSLGTSVGFGMTNDAGHVSRPRADLNWDIGAMRVRTRASSGDLWWALGSHGLAELQRDMGDAPGTHHYGIRLGGLIRDLSILFRPRTVILAGGIAARRADTLVAACESELRESRPDYMELPALVLSPFGETSGLVGAAVAASKL